MKRLTIVLGLLLLSSCAYFQPLTDRAANVAADYCKKPYSTRVANRVILDQAARPNKIRFYCADDPDFPAEN